MIMSKIKDFKFDRNVTFKISELIDLKYEDEIEACFSLRTENMDKFEADLELEDFLSHHKTSFISKSHI